MKNQQIQRHEGRFQKRGQKEGKAKKRRQKEGKATPHLKAQLGRVIELNRRYYEKNESSYLKQTLILLMKS
jgi:hypothetical protein